MTFKAVTLGMVLAGTALGSAALSLERARGAAWIGQPLELVVPVQSDPGQTDTGLCAEADVFHGDSRQDSSRVQVLVMPGDQPETFNLKISSSALIDEPVVTVYLRAGCGQKSSRKYVFLADFPSDTTAPLSRTSTATTPQVPLVIPVETPNAAVRTVADTPLQSDPKPTAPVKALKSDAPRVASSPKVAKEVVKVRPKEVVKEAPKVVKPAAAADSTEGKPRLRLDPLDTLSERIKTLEASTAASAAQDDVARESQRMQALQTDLKTLLDQATKNEASLQALRERLEKAESERVPVGVVYGLAALVALCLGALAYLWSRRAKLPVWEQPAVAGTAPATPAASPSPRSPNDAGRHQDVDVAMVDMDDESFDQLMGQSSAKK